MQSCPDMTETFCLEIFSLFFFLLPVNCWRIWRKLYILRHLWTSKSAIFYWLCKLLDLLFLLYNLDHSAVGTGVSGGGEIAPLSSVQPKSGFSIGNRDQSPVSVSVLEPIFFFNFLLTSLGDISFLS